MTTLTDERLLRSIARRLAETADREQVIEEVCTLKNVSWSQAEELVDYASAHYEPEIIRQQTPILVLAAQAIFISGVLLAAWQLLGLAAVISAVINPNSESFLTLYNLSFGYIDALTNIWGILFSFATGMAMVLGSYFGMRDVWVVWLDAAERGELTSQDSAPALADLASPQPATDAEAVFTAEGWIKSHPNDADLVDFIASRLDRAKTNRDWLVTSVALSRGLTWPAAAQLVHEVAKAGGFEHSGQKIHGPAVVFSTLGIFLAGTVISLQYLVLLGVSVSSLFMNITDSYRFLIFLKAVNDYVVAAPLACMVFVLGFVMLIGGFLALRRVWPSVYRWQK